MVRKLILPTTIILLALSANAAFAGPTVMFGDLNTAKPADASTLAERVQTAATAYCGVTPETRHLVAPAFASAASSACIKQVTSYTLAEIQLLKSTAPQMAALQ